MRTSRCASCHVSYTPFSTLIPDTVIPCKKITNSSLPLVDQLLLEGFCTFASCQPNTIDLTTLISVSSSASLSSSSQNLTTQSISSFPLPLPLFTSLSESSQLESTQLPIPTTIPPPIPTIPTRSSLSKTSRPSICKKEIKVINPLLLQRKEMTSSEKIFQLARVVCLFVKDKVSSF